MRIEKILQRSAAVAVASAVWAFGIGAPRMSAQSKGKTKPACCGAKKQSAASKKATARFAARAERYWEQRPRTKVSGDCLSRTPRAAKTAVRAERGQVFRAGFEHEAVHDGFGPGETGAGVPRLPQRRWRPARDFERGVRWRSRARGHGDPNLSNRKFPYELKEEFDGPPERHSWSLRTRWWLRESRKFPESDRRRYSYFPRERYPNGWEIDDMVWNTARRFPQSSWTTTPWR